MNQGADCWLVLNMITILSSYVSGEWLQFIVQIPFYISARNLKEEMLTRQA